MTWLFSKRFGNIIKKEGLKVSITLPVRIRIWKLLERFDEAINETSDTGFNWWSSYLRKLPECLKSELGIKELSAYPENGKSVCPSDLEGFLLRGNYPPYFFDAIELFYDMLSGDKQTLFQKNINEIMEENNQCWRMIDGKIFPIDSQYIEEEIVRKSCELMESVQFQGAFVEFEKARIDIINNDFEGAIQNANLAIESTIKSVLKISKAKPGELFKKLRESGIIPEYYSGFLEVFEKNILRSVAIMRNEEPGAGHGKGKEIKVIPRSLAELGVNLAGVIIKYIIERHLEGKDNLEEY